jgi:CRP-like cAMP-binding protein
MQTILQELFTDKRLVSVAKGKVIVFEGHNINHIYLIASGYVKVYTIAGANLQRIPYIYKSGDIFPLTTFLSGSTIARFFYEAMTPVQVQAITSRQLENKVKDNLELGEELIRYTTRMDEQFIGRVNELISTDKPLVKIKNLLMFLVRKENTRKSIVTLDFSLTFQEIASMCGISQQEAIAQLRRLKSHGVISYSGRLTIDVEKLLSLKT